MAEENLGQRVTDLLVGIKQRVKAGCISEPTAEWLVRSINGLSEGFCDHGLERLLSTNAMMRSFLGIVSRGELGELRARVYKGEAPADSDSDLLKDLANRLLDLDMGREFADYVANLEAVVEGSLKNAPWPKGDSCEECHPKRIAYCARKRVEAKRKARVALRNLQAQTRWFCGSRQCEGCNVVYRCAKAGGGSGDSLGAI